MTIKDSTFFDIGTLPLEGVVIPRDLEQVISPALKFLKTNLQKTDDLLLVSKLFEDGIDHVTNFWKGKKKKERSWEKFFKTTLSYIKKGCKLIQILERYSIIAASKPRYRFMTTVSDTAKVVNIGISFYQVGVELHRLTITEASLEKKVDTLFKAVELCLDASENRTIAPYLPLTQSNFTHPLKAVVQAYSFSQQTTTQRQISSLFQLTKITKKLTDAPEVKHQLQSFIFILDLLRLSGKLASTCMQLVKIHLDKCKQLACLITMGKL
jgi:hypothetical protein